MQMQNVSTVSRLFIMFLSVFYLCSYYHMLILYNVFTLIYLFITYSLLIFNFL